jgi:hypothetical protein
MELVHFYCRLARLSKHGLILVVVDFMDTGHRHGACQGCYWYVERTTEVVNEARLPFVVLEARDSCLFLPACH